MTTSKQEETKTNIPVVESGKVQQDIGLTAFKLNKDVIENREKNKTIWINKLRLDIAFMGANEKRIFGQRNDEDIFIRAESGSIKVGDGEDATSKLKKSRVVLYSGDSVIVPSGNPYYILAGKTGASIYTVASSGTDTAHKSPEKQNSVTGNIEKIHELPFVERVVVFNIERETTENKNYRKVLWGGKFQLVLMHLNPEETIDWEIHQPDQFFRVESGSMDVSVKTKGIVYKRELTPGDCSLITGGSEHLIVATSEGVNVYTIYSHVQHKPGTVQPTKPQE
jgi:mannose-6-phosphate isomerase-like protein (cupin superfamily)